MRPLFGYPGEMSIPPPSVSNECSEPISGTSNAERSYIENIGSYEEYEELLRPIKEHNGALNHRVEDLISKQLEDNDHRVEDLSSTQLEDNDHRVEDLSSKQLEDNSRTSESKSDSLPQKGSMKVGKRKGKTKGKDQNLLYLDGKRWVPAVYHHKIRAYLIERASRKGQYNYPRERGPDPDDVTSYLESQKNWGPVRDENWAEVLYIFQKGEKHQDPTYKLKKWKIHGKIVLAAHDRRPMLRFRDLPDTLSSALHGRDMEAMKRTDPRIRQREFKARMPLHYTTYAGTRRRVQSHSLFGTRMTLFRREQGMPSWTGRGGSQTIQNALWERLPPENRVANSIRGLKPPTEVEQDEIRMGNAGKFLNRAGRRALTNEERERRQEIRERRLTKQRTGVKIE